MGVVVLPAKCTGCQECVFACPFGAIEMVGGPALIMENCTECMICVPVCPEMAIVSEAVAPGGRRGRQIWTAVEGTDGTFDRENLAALGVARALADELDARCVAVRYGGEGSDSILLSAGADEVLVLDIEGLPVYSPGGLAAALCTAVRDWQPEVLLFPGTVHGEELAARVASRLRLPLASHCVQAAIGAATGELECTFPAYGDGVLVTVAFDGHRPALLHLAPGYCRPPRLDPSREGKVTRLSIPLLPNDVRERAIGRERVERELALAEAAVVVCGGLQMGSRSAFEALAELAHALGGFLAGTQEVFERGWIQEDRVVDVSKGYVSPRLYVSFGDYGGPGHLGAIRAGYIVAIAQDPNAAIFQTCDLGLVADPAAVASALVKLLSKLTR